MRCAVFFLPEGFVARLERSFIGLNAAGQERVVVADGFQADQFDSYVGISITSNRILVTRQRPSHITD